MEISQKSIRTFQKKILTWYAQNKRDLPWRDVPVGISLQERAYRIVVSEVMSQQTQINRVIPKYAVWIQKFPTVDTLAHAKVSDVLAYWSGLGYNRRALNLKKTAEMIVKTYGGSFPQDEKQLLLLSGIGEYTARAVLCFAFDKQVAVVDTNVRKVILTQFFSEPSTSSGKKETTILSDKDIQKIAIQLLPVGKASEWNQALMDYAAAVLKKEKIPLPKQSAFIGSHRYYRGQILKVLLQKKQIAVSAIGLLIKKEYSLKEERWLEKLLQELVTEGFLLIEKGIIRLAI